MNTKISSEDLMLKYQLGDTHAFEELVKRHRGGVYNYIYRLTGNAEDSEDGVQEAFTKLHNAAMTYTVTAKFTTWFYTIVRNMCIDNNRKKKLQPTVSIEGKDIDSTGFHEVLPSPLVSPEAHSSNYQLNRRLAAALQRINGAQRIVFLMRSYMGYKFEDIAKETRVSVNTVKSRMRYAIKALNRILHEQQNAD